MTHDGFEDGFGIGDGHAYAEGEQGRQEENFLPPFFRVYGALSDEVEGADGDGGRDENGQVEDPRSPTAEVDGHAEARENQDTEEDEQEVGEIGAEVNGSLDFDQQRLIAAPEWDEQFFACLDAAFGPSMLLRLEAVHIDGQFGGGDDVVEEMEAPSFHLGAVAEVEVLGQGVVLPSSGVHDAGFAPDTGGSIKIDEPAGATAGGLFDHEVAVEEHGLNAGQQAVVAVEVAPAGLDHTDFRIGEKVDHPVQDFWWRDEVGVQNEDIIAFSGQQAVFQGAGFVASPVGPVDEFGVESCGDEFGDFPSADVHGFVGGVVQHLDLQPVARVIEAGDGIDEAGDDMLFVKNGQLDGDQRQVFKVTGWLRLAA